MNIDDRVEFTFWETGSMLWVGALEAYQSFCRAWCLIENNVVKNELAAVRQLILERQVVMPMSLYQDDSYTTRIVLGELNAAEQANWLARVVWQLNLPTGQLVVSGIVDSEIADVPALAEADLDDLKLCSVDVPPGNYTVTVYAYLPDLTGEWINIISGKSAHRQSDLEPENPLAYFRRTRPEAPIPAWLGMNFAETKVDRNRYTNEFLDSSEDCIEFIVQLLPGSTNLPVPTLEVLEDGMFLNWEFRKPDRFPQGIPPLLDFNGWTSTI